MTAHLVVNLSFNCPKISITGPIKESTIDRLNEILPTATTSTRSIRSDPPQFQFLSNPEHWFVQLDGQFCDAEGVSRLMVVLLDALEEEGGWTLSTSDATCARNSTALQQDVVEHYQMIFLKHATD